MLARLTPQGRTAMERATEALHEIEFGLGALDDDQHRDLFRLLHAVRTEQGDFEEGEA
ncbi:hypothetical protein [Barrientosiimonas endolithica]|nr:hypothetical protein [Barrientosiimonas endolithica]